VAAENCVDCRLSLRLLDCTQGGVIRDTSIKGYFPVARVGAIGSRRNLTAQSKADSPVEFDETATGHRWVVTLFLVAVFVPIVLQAGPLRLSPYRAMLLVTIIPCIFLWLGGRAGRIRLADLALLVLCLWSVVSLVVIHGAARTVESGGILFAETMGAFLLARIMIRSASDFHNLVRTLFWIVLALLPFAIIEAFTNHAIILETTRKFFRSYTILHQEARWGLRRVQGPFEHPILFGAFCGSIVGMVYYVLGYGQRFYRRLIKLALVTGTAVLSLSSGPLTSVGAQLGLIGWDLLLGRFQARWKFLAAIFVSAVVAIEILANRSSAQILISFVAFNGSTAYNRLRIWEYGSASVLNNPVFGIGFNEWERPSWMLASIDMFWLVPAVRSGLFVGILLQIVFFAVIIPVIFRKGLDAKASSYRTGYIISLLGIYIAGWTVHYWNSVYVLLFFLLGSGAWFLDAGKANEEAVRQRRRQQRIESNKQAIAVVATGR
jgi:hypothetical protein